MLWINVLNLYLKLIIMKQHFRYSYLINFFVVLGDFIILNFIFGILYRLFLSYLSIDFHENVWIVMILMNICYVPPLIIFGVKLAKRIVYAEKIVQNVSWMLIFYFILSLAVITVFKLDEISRLFFATYFSLIFVLVNIWRLFFRFALKKYRNSGFNLRNAVIVGAGKNGYSILKEMSSDEGYGFRFKGFFDDNPDNVLDKKQYLGTVDQAIGYISENLVDEVYCALPDTAESKTTELMRFCEHNMIRFFLVPVIHRSVKKSMKLELFGGVPVFVIREEPLQYPLNRIVKRTFDVVFSLLFLLTLFPIIFIIVGTVIKLTSPGPIFFTQERTGKKGKNFKCFKFRTMKVNKDSDTLQAVKGDPRVTKFGAFMRRTNIDELPQFINVLLGDMSVVGPRPHMLKHTVEYSALIDKYMLRHLAKPGITGWAQVNGYRGETKELYQMEKRVEYDVWYIENWSFFLDLKIIYLTIANMIKGEKNAY